MEINKEDVTVNMQHLAAPVKTAVDKYQLIPEFLKVRGLVKQQLVSFNYFANIGIREIVSANSVVKCTADPEFTLRYMDVRVGVPSKSSDHATEKLTPHCCRLSDITYSAPIVANIQYMRRTNGIKKILTKEVVIGRLPIMLRSCRCVLNGKDETELAKMGECPLDPGGYFIVKGTEKVPIMVVMKAMGMESDQEVVQMIGRDPRYASLLLPSIQEAAALNVFTQQQALENLEKVVKSRPTRESQEGRAFTIIRDIFLANVAVHQLNFRPKCIYAAVMLRRMMDAILNKDTMDDKDYVGNKRLELSGQSISLLFEDLFKTMNKNIQDKTNYAVEKSSQSAMIDMSNVINHKFIIDGLERALSTGNWDIPRFNVHKKGMLQVLASFHCISGPYD